MMSIIRRARDILVSNIHTKIDQASDPEKEVNQFLRELERDLREIKAETEAAVVNSERTKRKLNECVSEIKKMERYAVKALEDNQEEKARKYLTKKQTLNKEVQALEKQYDISTIKVEQIRLAQDKLGQDVEELRMRRDELVNRLQVAKSRKKVFEIGNRQSQSNVRLTTFDQLQEKADRALAEAEAMEQLKRGIDYEIERLGD